MNTEDRLKKVEQVIERIEKDNDEFWHTLKWGMVGVAIGVALVIPLQTYVFPLLW